MEATKRQWVVIIIALCALVAFSACGSASKAPDATGDSSGFVTDAQQIGGTHLGAFGDYDVYEFSPKEGVNCIVMMTQAAYAISTSCGGFAPPTSTTFPYDPNAP